MVQDIEREDSYEKETEPLTPLFSLMKLFMGQVVIPSQPLKVPILHIAIHNHYW